ncbi:glycoside hydrolase family 3 N-terminal domain-containing protein [Nakamurella sp. UYEF19]|uniref:glycoside hydrolase family 3 N-terminal domain-containing protein n=1 Tax=Nakamurella sp. UYEF19 TaxID=1756392 RepID=UPI0033930946
MLLSVTACTSGSTVAATVTTDTTVAAASAVAPTSAPIGTAIPSTSASTPRPTPATTTPSRTTPSRTTLSTTTTTSRTTGTSSKPPATSCAAQILAGLTEPQRIGQLLMVGIAADDPASGRAALRSTPVGGVFLSGRSTASAQDLAAGIAAVQQTITPMSGVRAHVAVDQEGGYVQGLRGPDFPSIPTAVQQGQDSSEALAQNTAEWASLLVKAGITLDLAPVADVVPAGTASDNPPIGAQDRQYGSTADSVSESVVTVVKAMLGEKLGTTVKHFPGLGRVTANTDTSADAVDDETTATDDSLDPFRAAIKAGTTAVMISSARYPQLDPDNIAAFSAPIVTDLLRGKLGFDGLIISDDLGGAVAVSDVPVGQRAVEFVRAGGDMALTVKPSDLVVMTSALATEVKASESFRVEVDAAALHVLASKQSLGLLACG